MVSSAAPDESQRGSEIEEHTCLFPTLQPDAAAGCASEAAAYAAAVITLQDAQKAANEAYRRWYECQYRGMDVKPVVEIPSSELSVLVRD